MSDLKLIDELLCDIHHQQDISWPKMERYGSSVERKAIQRLREAWKNGEMPAITLSLANYFESVTDTTG